MKTLFLILILSFAAFGQSKQRAETVETTRVPLSQQWKLITESTDDGVRWYFQTYTKKRGDVEVWIKQQSPKPDKIVSRPSIFSKKTVTQYLHFMLMYATFYCSDNRYTMESITPYGTNGKPLSGNRPMPKFREPVIPGTVIGELFSYFCN